MQGYHILALVLFSPALIAEPQLLAVSLAIACALLIIVEAIRVSHVPYLGPWIHSFMTSFIDERDSGMLLVILPSSDLFMASFSAFLAFKRVRYHLLNNLQRLLPMSNAELLFKRIPKDALYTEAEPHECACMLILLYRSKFF